MGDPEAENRFAHAREIYRRALKRRVKDGRRGDTILAGVTLRAPVQPLPVKEDQPSEPH